MRLSGRMIVPVLLALAAASSASAADTVRVSTAEAQKQAIKKPQPMYPAMARQMRLSGKVEVDVTVDEQGAVDKTQVVSGNAILAAAAQMAAKNWSFKPFEADGKALKVITRLSFTFVE